MEKDYRVVSERMKELSKMRKFELVDKHDQMSRLRVDVSGETKHTIVCYILSMEFSNQQLNNHDNYLNR